MKRTFDIAVSLIALIALSPIVAVVSLLILIFLGSPLLFVQVRPGLHMKPFSIYKFRTMKDLRDKNGEPLPDALRQSGFGNMLRKLSLDEIPQLVNVLKGEMSLIGPRPLLMKYLPYYTELEKKRFTVRPGITGLAQVSGRNTLDWNERLQLDVDYVENLSFLLDMKILFLTFVKVIRRDGIVTIPGSQAFDMDYARKTKPEFAGIAMPGEVQKG